MEKNATVFEMDQQGNRIERKITLRSNDGGVTFFSNPDTETAVKNRREMEMRLNPLTARARQWLNVLDAPTTAVFHAVDKEGFKAAVRYHFTKGGTGNE